MDEEGPSFVVEYANNARSKCSNKHCSMKIEKGCIRIGRLVSNPFHEGDQMTKWYHAECIFIALTRARATTKKIESLEDLSGRDSLEDEEKVQLQEWIDKYKDLKNVGSANSSKKRKKEEKEEVVGEAPKKKPKLEEKGKKKLGGKLKLPSSITSSPTKISSPTISSPPPAFSSPLISSPPTFSPPQPKPKPAPKPKKETKKKQPKTETVEPKKKNTRRKKKKEDPDEYDNSEDDRDLSDGFVVDDRVVEHEDGHFSFRKEEDDEYSNGYSSSDGDYRPSASSGRGYGYDPYSDEDDEDDECYDEEDSYEDFGGSRRGGGGGGGNESGEWEEIPPHLLQEGNKVDREEYMKRHPEREVGMSELVGMGFDSSAVWGALETSISDRCFNSRLRGGSCTDKI